MSFPHSFPHAFPGLRRRAARAFFALLSEGPPWLQRAFGLRFMRALYTPFDTVLQRTTIFADAVWSDATMDAVDAALAARWT